MGLVNNPEWNDFLKGYSIGGALLSIGGLFLGPMAGAYVFLVCLSLLLGFWYYTWKRYEALRKLSIRLEAILHGDDSLDFVPDREGELAVLSGKIYKMTIRLREQAELLQKEKTYLKDALADISHQMKTPLTSLRLLFARTKDQESRQEAGNLLTRMEWLLEVLLKTAKLESGTIKFSQSTVFVKDLFQKALEPLAILLELKGVEVILPKQTDITYQGDFFWSVEAVGNLLKNCLEHTEEGGRIEITAKENPIYTAIEIRDTGTGFEEQDLPYLFDRFYRGVSTKTSGVGIGLFLAEQIIRRQNGTIQAANLPDGGAEFQIRIYKTYII